MDKINFVVIGNISYDYNYFPNRDNEELKEVMNYGGATIYSGIPASIFTKVGVAAKVGEDYNIDILKQYNAWLLDNPESSEFQTQLELEKNKIEEAYKLKMQKEVEKMQTQIKEFASLTNKNVQPMNNSL